MSQLRRDLPNLLCYLKVQVERFKGTNVIKQCYHCQGFGYASEICNFKPSALNILKNTSKIVPTCTNCSGPHVATYKVCPKLTLKFLRKKILPSKIKTNLRNLIMCILKWSVLFHPLSVLLRWIDLCDGWKLWLSLILVYRQWVWFYRTKG